MFVIFSVSHYKCAYFNVQHDSVNPAWSLELLIAFLLLEIFLQNTILCLWISSLHTHCFQGDWSTIWNRGSASVLSQAVEVLSAKDWTFSHWNWIKYHLLYLVMTTRWIEIESGENPSSGHQCKWWCQLFLQQVEFLAGDFRTEPCLYWHWTLPGSKTQISF